MYKLPLFNLHNVQQYKVFRFLKGLADLKMKILLTPFGHVVPNLYGFLKCELALYGFRRLHMEIFYDIKGLSPFTFIMLKRKEVALDWSDFWVN